MKASNENKLKLNLGSGQTFLPGYINCDVVNLPGVDRCFDLNDRPWPFENESVDEVLMDNVLEHLYDTIEVVAEVHRILKLGGKFIAIVPYCASEGAFSDPSHVRYFSPQSMRVFLAHDRCWYTMHCKFTSEKVTFINYPFTKWSRLRNLLPFKQVLRRLLWNMYDYIKFELTK